MQTALFILACTPLLTNCFIISTYQGIRKCFKSDISSHKTLQVKFSFPRRQQSNCRFKLQIKQFKDQYQHEQYEQHYQNEQILDQSEFTCHEMGVNQPYVYKHTPNSDQSLGYYKICIENLEDYGNKNILTELIIAQRLHPGLYSNVDEIPLVESGELVEIENVIISIRNTLLSANAQVEKAEKTNDRVSQQIQQADQITKQVLYFQLVFLVVYAVIWVKVISTLNKNPS